MAYKSKFTGREIDDILDQAQNPKASNVVMDESGTTLDLFATQAVQALADLATEVGNLTPITMTESEYAAAAEAGTIDENKTYYVIGDDNE